MRTQITNDYMAFMMADNVGKPHKVALFLSVVQHLVDTGLTFRTINNYVSTLKAILTTLGFKIVNFEHDIFKAFMKSLVKIKLTKVVINSVLTILQLDTFFKLNFVFPDFPHYALSFSLALFIYLLISYLVPVTKAAFDASKQLTMADVTSGGVW